MSNLVLRAALSGAVVMLVPLAPASAVTFTATAATIVGVFAKAGSGDTIKLSGAFGLTKLQGKSSATAITLDASKAVFTDTLEIIHVDGLHIYGGKFDVTSGTSHAGHAAVAYGGSNIWFDKATVIGVGNQQGIGFSRTTNVQVTNSSFTGLGVGVGLDGVTGGVLTKNNFLKAYSDGIDIGGSHNVTASYNSCAGTVPGPGVHPDCIQMWSITGQPLQSDNTVSYNSAMGATQGFTSFAGGGGGLRLSILHNQVYSSYAQGIACYDCIDSNISFNSVNTIQGSRFLTNIHVVGGSGDTVVDNTIGTAIGLTGAPSITTDAAVHPLTSASVQAMVAPGNANTGFASGVGSTVAEPGTWAMLIAGFGLVGLASRRRAPRMVAA